jgi:hypothetical protein
MKKLTGKILILLSLVLLLTHVFSEQTIQLAFEMNSSYIQSELCINKDNPESSCFGKCYLSNQIEKNQERKQSPEYQINKQTFYLPVLKENKSASITENTTHSFGYHFLYSNNYTSSLLRPP